jgi:cytidylate kinase
MNMAKKSIITISGSLGSGKSSTAKAVAAELGYRHFSAGDFQRATAASLGLAFDEYQALATKDPQYDKKADNTLIAAGQDEKVVIDARLGYHFIPDSYKVFLFLDPTVAAERIFEDAKVNPNRTKEITQGLKDIESIKKSLEVRLESEKQRYKQFYAINDLYDPSHFDLVIDTKTNDLSIVTMMVLDAYRVWQKS